MDPGRGPAVLEHPPAGPAGTVSRSSTQLPSGALVFAAGTIQWSWGLAPHYLDKPSESYEDPPVDSSDPRIQQATYNIFSDGGVAPLTPVGVLIDGNEPPEASFTATPNPTTAGSLVTFNASGTTDSDGTIVKYEWDLDGNGSFETEHRHDAKRIKDLRERRRSDGRPARHRQRRRHRSGCSYVWSSATARPATSRRKPPSRSPPTRPRWKHPSPSTARAPRTLTARSSNTNGTSTATAATRRIRARRRRPAAPTRARRPPDRPAGHRQRQWHRHHHPRAGRRQRQRLPRRSHRHPGPAQTIGASARNRAAPSPTPSAPARRPRKVASRLEPPERWKATSTPPRPLTGRPEPPAPTSTSPAPHN